MSILKSKWFKFLVSAKLRPSLVGISICLLFSITLGALTPKFIKSFYDSFSDESLFLRYSGFLLVIFFFEYFNRAIFQIQVNGLIKEMIFFVRGSSYETWLKSYEIKSKGEADDPYPLGEVMARIMNDSESIRELITSGAFGIFIDLCFIISCLVSFVFLNAKSGFVLMGIEVFACFALIYGSKYMAKVFLAVRAASGFMSRKIANMVGGIRESYYNSHHNYASKESLKTFNNFLNKQLVANVWDASYYSIAESLFPLLLLVIVVILPYSQITEVAVVVAIIDLIQRSINPIKEVAGKISNIQRAATGVQRIETFLDDLEQGGMSDSEKNVIDEKVEYFNLEIDEFVYPKVKEEKQNDFKLEKVDIKASRGDYIGILGHSGSGKSTILNLAAMNLCPPNLKIDFKFEQRHLVLDSENLESVSLLKSQVGLISQDSHLFSDTLAFNICLSHEDQGTALEEFWQQMREQFEYLRTWGIKLSDEIDLQTISLGQKQIISALRICYQRKPIVLFDEISSSMDASCERALRGIIKMKQSNSIVWVVTHRVESVLEATKILLVHEGKIVDQGTHEHLSNSSKLYGQFLAELRS